MEFWNLSEEKSCKYAQRKTLPDGVKFTKIQNYERILNNLISYRTGVFWYVKLVMSSGALYSMKS